MLRKHNVNRRVARPAAGFSMVELMVTVFVAGLLLAAAVPSFNRMTMTSRVTAQTNELVAAINFARSEAIKRNTSMALCRAANADATTCTSPATGDWQHWIVRPVAPAGANVVRRGVVNQHANTLAVRSNLTGDQVAFGPDGLARTGGAIVDNQRIHVCTPSSTDPDSRRRIVLGAGSRLITETFTETC